MVGKFPTKYGMSEERERDVAPNRILRLFVSSIYLISAVPAVGGFVAKLYSPANQGRYLSCNSMTIGLPTMCIQLNIQFGATSAWRFIR